MPDSAKDSEVMPAKRPPRRSYKAACAAFLLEADQTIAEFEEKRRLERERIIRPESENAEKTA